MYSMVLMMALGAGGEMPACHRGGRHGGHHGHCGGGHCGGGHCGGGGGGYCMGGSCGGGGCAGGVCYGGFASGNAMALASTEASATIVVSLPEDARLTIDGEATTSTSDRRTFVSPSLAVGKDFHYTLKAKVVRDGQPVTLEKTVTVRAGEETRVTLDVPVSVASR
jgi:uncharacterized protein (TIGR03000 family)